MSDLPPTAAAVVVVEEEDVEQAVVVDRRPPPGATIDRSACCPQLPSPYSGVVAMAAVAAAVAVVARLSARTVADPRSGPVVEATVHSESGSLGMAEPTLSPGAVMAVSVAAVPVVGRRSAARATVRAPGWRYGA